MQVFGYTITRTKAVGNPTLSSVESRGGWWPLVRESWAGAFQANVDVNLADVLVHATVYACISLIAGDIAKMRLRLVSREDDGRSTETENPAYSPVLRRPNRYQNRLQFVEQWIASKLIYGNTYVLKQRDNRGGPGRGNVTALYILAANRVRPLIAPDGSVYYELKKDDLSSQHEELVIVPASEIIHDLMIGLYHPLVGVSPIAACGLAATQGLKIQNNSTYLFTNGSNPGGVLTAPGAISQSTADRLKTYWESAYTGANVGKIAVLGDGLKFEQMAMTAVDAQLIDQLKWTAEAVCSTFKVPPYMVGVGPPPNYNNIEALNQQYYSQCLQTLIESLEVTLGEGMEVSRPLEVEFDITDLLRMDTATKMATVSSGVKSGIYTPNEARAAFNRPPLEGGDTVYLQEQDHALDWLAARDEAEPEPAPAPAAPAEEGDEMMAARYTAALLKATADIHAT